MPRTRFFDGCYSKRDAAFRIVSLFQGVPGVFRVDNQGLVVLELHKTAGKVSTFPFDLTEEEIQSSVSVLSGNGNQRSIVDFPSFNVGVSLEAAVPMEIPLLEVVVGAS